MNRLFDKLDAWGLKPLRNPNDKPPITQKDVDDLERMFGYRFPPVYSEFLLRYGISTFYDGRATFDVPDNWNDLTEYGMNDIRVFYGIDTRGECMTFSLEFEIHSTRTNRLPSYFLPVSASDGLATIVYLSCREQDYGHVYALSRTQIWDVLSEEEAEKAAFHIANSFEEFLGNLRI